MRRVMRWIAIAGLLSAGVASAVAAVEAYAQSGPGGPPQQIPPATPVLPPATPLPPPPVTPVPAQPYLFLMQRTHDAQYGYNNYPFDFQFADQVVGNFFKPGERVTVTVQNTTAAPVTVTADAAGGFDAEVDFTWRFCGPSGTRAKAPVFRATGDQGSSAEITDSAFCPYLQPLIKQPVPVPPGKPISATAQPVGTAQSGVATPVQAPPPGTPPLPGPPIPAPTAAPQPQTFTVQGFGFVQGEHVTVAGTAFGSNPAPAPAHIIADSLGRIQLSMQVHVPPPCGPNGARPRLVASGDKGTSVVAPLIRIQPMVLCAQGGASGPSATGTPQPRALAPVATDRSASLLSASFRPTTVQRGHFERALIQASANGTMRLTVRYQGGARTGRTVKLGAGGSASARWRVPMRARSGKAVVDLTFQPDQISIQTAFKVR